MPRVVISLPDLLYAELTEVARQTEEFGYGPNQWATDLIASELAARRLPRVAPGRCGAQIKTREPEPYRVSLPDTGHFES
jgi:hypothetical protein